MMRGLAELPEADVEEAEARRARIELVVFDSDDWRPRERGFFQYLLQESSEGSSVY